MSLSHRQDRSGVEAFWAFSDKQWTRSDLTLAEGPLLARRLLASALVPEAVLCLASHEPEFTALAAGRCPVTILTPAEMEKWAGFAFHRGVLAVAQRPAPLSLQAFLERSPAPRRLAVAPRLTDPENLGSVYRSALALGWDAVAVGPETCDPFSRRTAKVSMGAVYSYPPVILPPTEESRRLFSASGWTNVALSLEPGAADLETWVNGEGKAALLGSLAAWVGNEFEGLAPSDRSVCDRALVVPMAEGHDSLNAAVAAGIGFYRLR